MRTRIGKQFDFEAAHQLRGEIYGKCQNLHGHRYHLVIEIEGDVNKFGWVCDFAELDELVNERVIKRYDHQNLSDHFEIPTVENIARSIFEILEKGLNNKSYVLSKVVLHETADSYAEVAR